MAYHGLAKFRFVTIEISTHPSLRNLAFLQIMLIRGKFYMAMGRNEGLDRHNRAAQSVKNYLWPL